MLLVGTVLGGWSMPVLAQETQPAPEAPAEQQPAETTIPSKVQLFIPYKEYTQEENNKVLELYKWLRVADISDKVDL